MEKQANPASAPQSSPEAHQKFIDLVRSFDTALLVTNRDDGLPHARPMAVADVTGEGDLWFITSCDAAMIEEAAMDRRALVTMQGSRSFLTVSGSVEIRRDPAKVKEIWKESFRPWFEDANDPTIRLLVVRAEEAEYWDNSGLTGIKFLLKAAAAVVSGKEMRDPQDPKIHAKVSL
jgi:general stress protein 26